MLQSDRLSVSSELELYKAVVAWGKHATGGVDGSGRPLAEAVEQPMAHVRLPLIATHDLMTTVR